MTMRMFRILFSEHRCVCVERERERERWRERKGGERDGKIYIWMEGGEVAYREGQRERES
jgi:hypothetical protein